MRHPRLLIALLLVATVLVDLAVLSVIYARRAEHLGAHPMEFALFALALSQVSLASFWAALGRQWVPCRLTAAFLVVAAWSVALREFCFSITQPLALLSVQSVVILGVLLGFRARGRYLICGAHTEHTPPAEERHTRWQFSLSYLFAWITGTAIVLGLFLTLMRHNPLPPEYEYYDWWLYAKNALINVVIALLVLPIALGTRKQILWGLAAASLLATVGVIAAAVSSKGSAIELTLLFGLEFLLLVGSLCVLRVAGCRVKAGGRQ